MNKGMEAPSPPTIGPLGVNGGEERNPTALNPGASARLPSAEARLIEQLRQGDPEAGHQFARDYYPDVYRYLLYLTGRAEMAEDLAQETFLHAWRRLDTFEGRASLRVWLHRIAHREFLQALRDQRPQSSLEDVSELVPARDAEWVETVELREAIRKLPDDEREVVVLHGQVPAIGGTRAPAAGTGRGRPDLPE